jgi:uncharacterized protein (TIGR03437 family)
MRLLSQLLIIVVSASWAWGQGVIRTIAGNGAASYSGDGGQAILAALNHARGIAVDASGNVYIADTDNSRIRRVSPTGMITTIAGNGLAGDCCDGVPAVSASLSDVMAVALDGQGNLYVADSSHRRIRKIGADGMINTIAGIGIEGFSGDNGPANRAMIGRPVAMTFDSAGNLYFADSTTQRVRKITPGGVITTVAGNGIDAYSGDGGQATAASLGFPIGVAVDGSGNLYIADGDNNRVRKVTADGTITTVAGNGTGGYSGDGASAQNASLNIPSDVAVDAAGNLYIADAGNNRVRKVDTSGAITTVAGTGTNGFSGDGSTASQAMLNFPWGVATDATGDVYIADRVNNRVRYIAGNISIPAPTISDNAAVNGATFVRGGPIAPGAIVTVFGGNLSTGTASAAQVPLPTSLAGTSVMFNGVAAPLFYVSPSQINAQAPFDLGFGTVRVQVVRGAATSSVTNSTVAQYSPGIFIVNPTTSEGAILHASTNRLISNSNPATVGEYISLYVTGLGAVKVPVVSGTVSPSTPPLAETSLYPVVMIGGQSATVTYSGLAPGFIGLYQINAIVPPGVANGLQNVQVTIGGYTSNTAAMAVSR